MSLEFLSIETPEGKVQFAILLFLWIQYLLEIFIAVRQYLLTVKTTKVPVELKEVLKDDTFQKARLYSLDKGRFAFIQELYSTIITTCVLVSGMFAIIWQWCNKIYPTDNEIIHSCIWLFIIQLLSTIINLPFSIYYIFVLEERHGFNKQTARFFIVDKLKGFVLMNVIALPLAALTIVIIKNGGDYFFLWLWLFAGVVTLLLLTIYPAYIAPLFDKYTPLPEGELRQSIEALAAELKFPLGQLYLVEGSKRSAHSNAYVFGLFGSKRIVLFDTLLGNEEKPGCTNEQILAVLSHELGHWKFGHITKNMILAEFNLLLMFGAFALMFKYEPLYSALGFPANTQPILVGLIGVLQFVLAPYNAIMGCVFNALSRRFEFQADGFAVKLKRAEPLQEALIKLTKDNLGFPIYDKFYSAYYHSHPPLLQRLERLTVTKTK